MNGATVVRNFLKQAPKTPGVYIFKSKEGEVLYVGKAVNIKNRLSSYTRTKLLGEKTRKMIDLVSSIIIIKTFSEFDALLLESKCIRMYSPYFNSISKDDKKPLYIKITKELYPKVSTSRIIKNSDAYFFGPFPNAKSTRDILKTIRRIFPYCSDKHIYNKPCFYSHLKLCNPCPNVIVKLPDKEKDLKTKEYQLSVRNLRQVLSGKRKIVQNELAKKMKEYASLRSYEKASLVKKQLDLLYQIVDNTHPINSYLANPNLYEDIKQNRINQLKKILQVKKLYRIEGYDASTTGKDNCVVGMVVFENGEKTPAHYRKFKIKFEARNDFDMLTEAIWRRFTHTEWQFPDLILLDGGKPQLRAVLHMFERAQFSIPIIGLEKMKETIVIPLSNTQFDHISLTNSSPALLLLQSIRNEAHRFSHAYSTRLRKKSLLK